MAWAIDGGRYVRRPGRAMPKEERRGGALGRLDSMSLREFQKLPLLERKELLAEARGEKVKEAAKKAEDLFERCLQNRCELSYEPRSRDLLKTSRYLKTMLEDLETRYGRSILSKETAKKIHYVIVFDLHPLVDRLECMENKDTAWLGWYRGGGTRRPPGWGGTGEGG